MFKWLDEYLMIKLQYKRNKLEIERAELEPESCESCETLRMQLAIANDEKKMLLDRLLEKPTSETPVDTMELKPILPQRHMTFGMRKQMLEAEDRRKAVTIKEFEDNAKDTIKDLEKELDIVAELRESTIGTPK